MPARNQSADETTLWEEEDRDLIILRGKPKSLSRGEGAGRPCGRGRGREIKLSTTETAERTVLVALRARCLASDGRAIPVDIVINSSAPPPSPS